jgi:ankyrin repeat protein
MSFAMDVGVLKSHSIVAAVDVNEQLRLAIIDDDIGSTRQILDSEGFRAGGDAATAMLVATQLGRSAVCRLLVERGADVNAQKYLVRAALIGNTVLCGLLLDAGADINDRDSWGRTALMAAVTSGRVDACKILLNRGAIVDLVTEYGTALGRASSIGNVALVQCLIDAGANPGLAEGDQVASGSLPRLTPFQSAVRHGNIEVVRYFLACEGEDPAQRTVYGETMLRLAGKDAGVKQILRAAKTEAGVRRILVANPAPDVAARKAVIGGPI